MEFGVSITVYTGEDYEYVVTVNSDSELSVAYKETYADPHHSHTSTVTFGSREEMKAVAEAMLRALGA